MLLVGTGAVSVAFLPFWLNWLRLNLPGVELRLVLTRSAEAFVSPAAMGAISGREVVRDAWPSGPAPHALHVEFAEWADTIVVYPATLHYVSRLALGMADTPTLLALQCTQVPVGVAPALPPGAEHHPTYRTHLAALEQRENVVVAPPHAGRSATTGRHDAAVSAPLSTVLELVESHRAPAMARAT